MMLKKIKQFFRQFKYRFSYEWCYDGMEQRGIAVFGCCCGTVGGTAATEYLDEGCIGCPYWTPVFTKECE